MKRKLLKLHKKWLELGEMPSIGLCCSLPKEYEKTFKFLHPTFNDSVLLSKEGMSYVYCGCEIKDAKCITKWFSYTPLRQSLVLLLAEMIEDPFFTEKTQ